MRNNYNLQKYILTLGNFLSDCIRSSRKDHGIKQGLQQNMAEATMHISGGRRVFAMDRPPPDFQHFRAFQKSCWLSGARRVCARTTEARTAMPAAILIHSSRLNTYAVQEL